MNTHDPARDPARDPTAAEAAAMLTAAFKTRKQPPFATVCWYHNNECRRTEVVLDCLPLFLRTLIDAGANIVEVS